MVFDLNQMKDDMVATIKAHMLPEEQSGTIDFGINDSADYYVLQSFKPYSSAYRETTGTPWRSFPIDLSIKKTGSPTGSIEVYLLSDDGGVPSNTICGRTLPPGSLSTSYSNVRFWMDLSDIANPHLGTNKQYWIEINSGHSVDPSNYYSIQRHDVDTGYMMGSASYKTGASGTLSTLAADINFRVSLPTWIYPDYPFDNLSQHSYPRIAVDVLGRPRIDYRWIDAKLSDMRLNIGVTFYSKYPRLLDELISYVDRGIWYERTSISSFRIVRPGNISTVVKPNAYLFVKTVIYQCVHRETASGIT